LTAWMPCEARKRAVASICSRDSPGRPRMTWTQIGSLRRRVRSTASTKAATLWPRLMAARVASWADCSPYSTQMRWFLIQFGEGVQHLIGHAIRSRADGQTDNVRNRQRLFIDLL